MENICIQYHKTKIGELILGSFKEKLCLLDFNFRKMRNAVDDRIKKGLNAEFKEEDSDIIEKTRTELEEYFQGERKEFDVPIQMVGTDFQKKCLECIIESSLWHHIILFAARKSDKQCKSSSSCSQRKRC